jgi:hypothetical protein
MKTQTKKLILLVSIFFFSSAGHTISKDMHQVVTITSINAYQNCIQKLQLNDSLKAGINSIVKATKEEDESPLLERYLNWHFYDAFREDNDNRMGRSLTGARKSLHYIYNDRVDSLVDAINKTNLEQIYQYTGSVLHYIQDMTVPAHVAPIYHYKFLFIDKSDYFDEMPGWKGTIRPLTDSQCEEFNKTTQNLNETLNTLLESTADGTRKRIKQKFNVSIGHALYGKTWKEEFWNLRDLIKEKDYAWDIKNGFAPYGNQGEKGFENLCLSSSSIDRSLCLSFFNKSHIDAIYNSVRVLMLINNINNITK